MKAPRADSTEARPPAERILRPFEEFAAIEASGGIVLLGGMLVALTLANSPWAAAYSSFWSTELGVSSQWLDLTRPLSLLGAGFLCGIGFTMSLFVGNLAFGQSHAIESAKLGILLASATAGLVGAALLTLRPARS